MWFVIVGVLLIVLHFLGVDPMASWGWRISQDLWKFAAPFALAAAWWAFADWSGYNKRREIERMEARKQKRREDNLAALGMDQRARRGGRPGKGR